MDSNDSRRNAEIVNDGEQNIMEQVEGGIFSSSQIMSHHVIDECILQEVAQQMWSKELLQKYQKSYLSHQAKSYGTHMYQLRADDKVDDE